MTFKRTPFLFPLLAVFLLTACEETENDENDGPWFAATATPFEEVLVERFGNVKGRHGGKAGGQNEEQ